jgi:threonine dehydrogenase-like Zn-dependent dehydrogenase
MNICAAMPELLVVNLKAHSANIFACGRFVSFSLGHADFSGLSAFGLYFKEISIIGARALTHVDMAPSIELVASGKIDVSSFITSRYPLDQVAAAFEEYERNPSRILRIVIDAGIE